MKCECADPACPICLGRCKREAEECLFRIDTLDVTGTCMCEECAADALASGVYTTHDLEMRSESE